MATAKFRHIAISTEDPRALADWYKDVFGLVEMGPTGHGGVYLSDGDINFAILRIARQDDSGKAQVGVSHYGFRAVDAEATYRKLAEAGAKSLPGRPLPNQFFEAKFEAPDGIGFEISDGGWPGTTRPGEENSTEHAIAKFRHVAIAVPDPEQTARWYQDVFGFEKVGRTGHGGYYLSDGDVNFAVLYARARDGESEPRPFFSHFGFMVADPEAMYRKLEQVGAKRLPSVAIANQFFESKFEALDGVSFDISDHGWPGTTPVGRASAAAGA
jgi:methylmalonyl-CoA/ethylmalonyl-CoA epimerase